MEMEAMLSKKNFVHAPFTIFIRADSLKHDAGGPVNQPLNPISYSGNM